MSKKGAADLAIYRNNLVEKILLELDNGSRLFPQFKFTLEKNMIKCIGHGGFAYVYEMHSKNIPENKYALKVTVGSETNTSEIFDETCYIQNALCEESDHIVRLISYKEIYVYVDEQGNVLDVKEEKDINSECIDLQLVLMEKVDSIISRNRLDDVILYKKELLDEKEIIRLGIEIAEALEVAHQNKWIHRDIKLENIFWDTKEEKYKLGDFGIAKITKDGSATTMAFTEGYGAPEIRNSDINRYDATVDIYSLGMCLYLLLNNLHFPGSENYNPSPIQFIPDFILPAPAHNASKLMHVIRKMCTYDSQLRYQSASEVIQALYEVLNNNVNPEDENIFLYGDIETETVTNFETVVAQEYENSINEKKYKEKENKQTRSERIRDKQRIKKIDKQIITEERMKYFFLFSASMFFLFEAFNIDISLDNNWMIYILPVMALIEGILQKLKEWNRIFGGIIIVYTIYTIVNYGLMMPQIIIMVCIISGLPLLSISFVVSMSLWIALHVTRVFSEFEVLYKYDLGWIILGILLIVLFRYILFVISTITSPYEINEEVDDIDDTDDIVDTNDPYYEIIMAVFILFIVLIILGLVLFVVSKLNMIELPNILFRIHFIRTSIIFVIGMACLYYKDMNIKPL